MSVPELMNVFYFNRLSARVFTADPDGWLIKGGQALLVRYEGAARLSRDIDLQCVSPHHTVEEAASLLKEAVAVDLGDFLRFVPTKFVEHSDEGRGGAQSFAVYLGARKAADIKVDLVVGRTLAGRPETRTLKSAVDLEWPVDWPQVRLYPVIDHVADKICAMYERHGPKGQHGSNRYRDLADLLLITQQETIEGQEAHQALHREADRRRALGLSVALPEAFESPGPDWPTRYPEQASLVLGLVGCHTFPEAAQAAASFVDPLFDGSVRGTWNPQVAAWC
ncbi:nucleotidyl transferase AbiEii/AbiGii toxin family protein [Streptomyces javensis]|uniref:Nucleotidyl transferase AbiEii/AbiGii toxin family protein n=2 Tax=Streptomyces javensis TaxID=114698 RepID=A0ABS0RHV6_9ACTN|nr:nucleotidyl transferase AbiEii/AbiGii toxin family protein [Streptomyces javensis]